MQKMASWEEAHEAKSISELNEISQVGKLTLSREAFLSAPLYPVICSGIRGSAPRDGNPPSKVLNKQAFEFPDPTTYFQLLALVQRKETGECKAQHPRTASYLLFLPLYLSVNKTQFLQTQVCRYQPVRFFLLNAAEPIKRRLFFSAELSIIHNKIHNKTTPAPKHRH